MESTVPDAVLPLDGSVRRLDPRARALWAIRRSALWVVAGIVLVVVAAVNGSVAGVITVVVVAGVCTVLSAGSAVLSYRYWSWTATDDAVEIAHGVLFRHVSVVPYHRIQQIDIDRAPLERILRIATLVLRTAAATTDARVPGIALDHAEAFRKVLLVRAGADDAV